MFVVKHQHLPGFHDYTMADMCRKVVVPECSSHRGAYVDLFTGKNDERGRSLLGIANTYVSHVWSYKFGDTLDVMAQQARERPGTYFWLDIFVIGQTVLTSLSPEFRKSFMKSIKDIGSVLLVMSPWRSPRAISRLWCLWEVMCALGQPGVKLMIKFPRPQLQLMRKAVIEDSDAVIRALNVNVASEKAECSRESDKVSLSRALLESFGFESINVKIKAQLRGLYMRALKTVVMDSSKTFGAAKLLGQMGVILSSLGLMDDALVFHEKSLAICVQEVGPNHLNTAQSFARIGQTYLRRRDFEAAISNHSQAIAIYESMGEKDNTELIINHRNLGLAYTSKGDFERAVIHLQRELDILLAHDASNEEDIAVCHGHIGEALDGKGDYEKAIVSHQAALEYSLRVNGPTHQVTAIAYDNIALACCHLGNFSKAIDCLERSIEIKSEIVGETSMEIVPTYNNIAAAYFSQGHAAKALQFFERSVAICLKSVGSNHRDTATAYNGIGVIYFKKGQLEKAIDYIDKCLAIRIATLGPNHPDTAGTYANIGNMYLQINDCTKAIENCSEAIKILESTVGERHPETASCYFNLGVAYEQAGNKESAFSAFSHCLTTRKETLGEDHQDTQAVQSLLQDKYESFWSSPNAAKPPLKHPRQAPSSELIVTVCLFFEHLLTFHPYTSFFFFVFVLRNPPWQ
jgi:tetratricopeptide (TPR) repeat protein